MSTPGSSSAVSGTDGLIPLGCMPSGRFGSSVGGGISCHATAAAAAAAAAAASPGIRAARRQLVETRQRQLEASIAGQLKLYARHRWGCLEHHLLLKFNGHCHFL
jgi:hypothetical protein